MKKVLIGIVVMVVFLFLGAYMVQAAGMATCTGRLMQGKSMIKENVTVKFQPYNSNKSYEITTNQGVYKMTDLPAGHYKVTGVWGTKEKSYEHVQLLADKTKYLHINFGVNITFEDANLENAVRKALSKPAGMPITSEDALTLITLEAKSMDGIIIKKLGGLEYFTNLEKINLDWNKIQYLAPLSGLKKLKELSLAENQLISDLTPLKGLKNLFVLTLAANNISDLGALSGLTKLDQLDLAHNAIADITPLGSLTALTFLKLQTNNGISDLSTLTKLVNLESFYIGGDQALVSDISALAGLKYLKDVGLNGCPNLLDITPLIENAKQGGLGIGVQLYYNPQIPWDKVKQLIALGVKVQPGTPENYKQ